MKYALAFLAGSACGLYVWAWLVERLFPSTPYQPIPTPLPQRIAGGVVYASSSDYTTWTANDRSTWTAHI